MNYLRSKLVGLTGKDLLRFYLNSKVKDVVVPGFPDVNKK